MAQYRGPGGLHAYEFETWFDVHRDRHDPREEPFLHVLFEAGEIIAAIVAAVVAGFTTWVAMERREREKPERERSWLFPVLAALGVALFAGIVVYGLGSLARVALGSG